MTEFNLRAIIAEYAPLLEDVNVPSPQTLYKIYAKRPARERKLMTFPRLVALVQNIDRATFAALSPEEKERYLVSAYFSH